MPDQTALEFERETWRVSMNSTNANLCLKSLRHPVRGGQVHLSSLFLPQRWQLSVTQALIWLNGMEQRKLETEKSDQVRNIEETKAEAARHS